MDAYCQQNHDFQNKLSLIYAKTYCWEHESKKDRRRNKVVKTKKHKGKEDRSDHMKQFDGKYHYLHSFQK